MELSALLERTLNILKPYLNKKGIVEISINEPGVIWMEKINGHWIKKKDKKLTLNNLLNLAKILATETGQEFSDEVPMLSLSLPKYGHRLQVISGASVDSGFALSIRLGTAKELCLSSWFNDEQIKTLKQYIKDRKTILVSGGTGSGKTTLLNSLLREIDHKDRIITLEDSKELIVQQPNTVRLLKSKTGTDVAKLSYKNFINVIMRFRPDRILLGEIDIENTLNFLRLINTGHDGSFATIHANSIDAAISALVINCALSGQVSGTDKQIEKYAMKHINVIVQVTRAIAQDKRVFSASFKEIK